MEENAAWVMERAVPRESLHTSALHTDDEVLSQEKDEYNPKGIWEMPNPTARPDRSLENKKKKNTIRLLKPLLGEQ